MDWGGWELRLRPAIPSGFISLWTPNRAGYTARTMADRLGSKFQKTAGFGEGLVLQRSCRRSEKPGHRVCAEYFHLSVGRRGKELRRVQRRSNGTGLSRTLD